MQWDRLISTKRAYVENSEKDIENMHGRRAWLVDLDRISFSAPFRRLQGKTQVHPLDDSAHVRTRLTHSLEVASVGRSLGFAVGNFLEKSGFMPKNVSAHDFGYIVQAACLAHDIGNPPFGHAGEDAIGMFFQRNEAKLFEHSKNNFLVDNLKYFEGNAQGFRILNRLTSWQNTGGLRLTYSTLAAFCKYPRMAFGADMETGKIIGDKKCGIFDSEREIFSDITKELGMIQVASGVPMWYRHPFSFLVEAADDICYSVADIEDAVYVDAIQFAKAEELLIDFARPKAKYQSNKRERIRELQKEDWYKNKSQQEKLDFLCGKAISNLISEVIVAFENNHEKILTGTLNTELLSQTPFKQAVENCKSYAFENIFNKGDKLKVEIAATKVLEGLLKSFCFAALDIYENKAQASRHSQKVMKLCNVDVDTSQDIAQTYMLITDYVGAMTDHYALKLYQKLSGINLS